MITSLMIKASQHDNKTGLTIKREPVPSVFGRFRASCGALLFGQRDKFIAARVFIVLFENAY